MSARDFVPPAYRLRATRCGSGTVRRRLPERITVSAAASPPSITAGERLDVDAQIEILGESHVALGCQGDGPDHQCLHASRLEKGGHLLGSPSHLIGI